MNEYNRRVKQTLIEEIEVSIRKANLAEDIPEIKIEIPKDRKMELFF